MAWFYWFPVPQVSRGAHSRGAHARAIMWERQEGQASKGYWCARGPQNRAGHRPTLRAHRLQLLCYSRIGADQARSQKKIRRRCPWPRVEGDENHVQSQKRQAHMTQTSKGFRRQLAWATAQSGTRAAHESHARQPPLLGTASA